MPQSVLQPSLCCRVFPAPGLLCAGLGGPVRNVMRRGGGRRAQKRGCSIVPTQSIHPPLICRSLVFFFFFFKGGGRAKKRVQSDGITDIQPTHTHRHWIEATLRAYWMSIKEKLNIPLLLKSISQILNEVRGWQNHFQEKTIRLVLLPCVYQDPYTVLFPWMLW